MTADTLLDCHVVSLAVRDRGDAYTKLLAITQDASSSLHFASLILVKDLALSHLVRHAAI